MTSGESGTRAPRPAAQSRFATHLAAALGSPEPRHGGVATVITTPAAPSLTPQERIDAAFVTVNSEAFMEEQFEERTVWMHGIKTKRSAWKRKPRRLEAKVWNSEAAASAHFPLNVKSLTLSKAMGIARSFGIETLYLFDVDGKEVCSWPVR